MAEWNKSSLPVAESWSSIAHGGGKFVAVQSSKNTNIAAVSSDGLNWSPVSMPRKATWCDVTYGNGKFVAVAGNTGTPNDFCAYSIDGVNWTESAFPRNDYWSAVTYGNGKFVAVAGSLTYSASSGSYIKSQKSAYSSDGINWTISDMPQSDSWIDVVYGNGKFVALAYGSSKAAYSTDGINWYSVNMPTKSYWRSVAYGNGIYIAISATDNYIAQSSDGISWTYKVFGSSSIGSDSCKAIIFGSKYFLILCNKSIVYYGYNVDYFVKTIPLPYTLYWTDIAYGNGKFVAVSNGTSSGTSGGSTIAAYIDESALIPFSVKLFANPETGGTVSGSGNYYSGTSVTVTATPADGWEFVSWTENGSTVSASASYTFTITASRTLTAVFKQKLQLWVGINGKARKGVELYVGVNGKARKVTEAYIGVNGKARRFL